MICILVIAAFAFISSTTKSAWSIFLKTTTHELVVVYYVLCIVLVSFSLVRTRIIIGTQIAFFLCWSQLRTMFSLDAAATKTTEKSNNHHQNNHTQKLTCLDQQNQGKKFLLVKGIDYH
jgi:hypothetical protein